MTYAHGDRVIYTGAESNLSPDLVGKKGMVLRDQRPDLDNVQVKWDNPPSSRADRGVLPGNLAKAPTLVEFLDESHSWEEDVVNHPSHYTSHPSGVECITITEHMSFTLGNAIKYIWRADLKGDGLEDLKKARFYIDREIAKREGEE